MKERKQKEIDSYYVLTFLDKEPDKLNSNTTSIQMSVEVFLSWISQSLLAVSPKIGDGVI